MNPKRTQPIDAIWAHQTNAKGPGEDIDVDKEDYQNAGGGAVRWKG